MKFMETEFAFKLPKGYKDAQGTIHREGVMRLATAADEIFPMKDIRVRENPEYASVLILARVITRLGTLEEITPEVIEQLYTADINFLQNMYQTINEMEDPMIQVRCPHCGKTFEDTINFTRME